MFRICLILFVSIYFVEAKHEEYEGYTLYGVPIKETEQVDQLVDIADRHDSDIWSYVNSNNECLILVAPEQKPAFEDDVIAAIDDEFRTENIKESLDLEDKLLAEAESKYNKSDGFGLSFDYIHRYAEVDRYLTEVAKRFPRVARVKAGKSFEGRNIKHLKISSNNFADKNKPIVVIQCLIHSNEWMTMPVALWAIQELVLNNTEPDLVRDIDWIITPIVNPDGYEFSHTQKRLWRKNRRPGCDDCVGVDLNRNFDFNWANGSSRNSCSNFYPGRRAFSEPESVITRNIIHKYKSRLALFLDIHSYGSKLLYGFGNRQLPPNAAVLKRVAEDMAQRIDAVKRSDKPNYRVGNFADLLYLAPGISADYAQNKIGNRLSYTIELPAFMNETESLAGFLVEPKFIRQACFETWEAIKVAARWVVQNRL